MIKFVAFFFKVDGYLQEPWKSVGMGMEEKYCPKREIKTRMENILDGGTKSGKVSSSPVDISFLEFIICHSIS
jgi:hypothetical protein